MPTIPARRLRSRCLATFAAALLTAPAVIPADAVASTRNYLTIEGRVYDHLGAPLAGTWIFCLGSRRASAPVDTAGSYRLEVPGATLEELERTPLKIRIQARRRGWRFALANGEPELGLEMRVVKDDIGMYRLRVRSNDSSAVAAVANSVVLDANPRALLEAQFVGSQGAQYDTPPVPLDEMDEITLAGGGQSIPELTGADTPAGPVTVSPPPPMNDTATRTTGEPLPAAAPRAASDTSATPADPRVTEAPLAAPADTRFTEPPAAAPADTMASSRDGGSPVRWDTGGNDRPRVYRPADDGRPARKPDRRTPKPRGRFTIAEGPVAVARTDSAATPSSDATPSPATAPRADAAPAAPGGDPTLHPVLRKDVPAERVPAGAQPPMQRVQPGSPPLTPPRAPGAPATLPMCDCTIRGTVEIQWDRPLASRTEVVIAVEDAPDISATTELFMGSPRAFEIHGAPCGVHRLRLWTRSKQRFVLASSEPRIVCVEGQVQQMRLVLEPVARWGAP